MPIEPADPPIANRAFQRRGGEPQQRYPFLKPGRDVPQRLANLRHRPEIMVRLHQLPIARLFLPPNLPYLNLFQHPPRARHSHRSHSGALYGIQAGRSSIRFNLFISLNFTGKANSPWGPGGEPVIRYKNPLAGAVIVDDQMHGRVVFENVELDDLIIARSDGYPS